VAPSTPQVPLEPVVPVDDVVVELVVPVDDVLVDAPVPVLELLEAVLLLVDAAVLEVVVVVVDAPELLDDALEDDALPDFPEQAASTSAADATHTMRFTVSPSAGA